MVTPWVDEDAAFQEGSRRTAAGTPGLAAGRSISDHSFRNARGPRDCSTGTTIAAAAPLAAVYSGGANLDTSASAEVSEVVSDGTQTVNLSGYYNLTGITTNGRPFWRLDGQGNAFSETQVGRSITWDGLTFPIGAPNVNDVVQGGGPAINLPAGNDSSVAILATGTNGNQPNQRFTINYTTGSPTYATQSISDWHVPQNYAGESIALITSYRNTSTGGRDTNGPFDVYGYSIPVDPTRTVASITLPNDSHVKVLSMIAVESVAPPTDLTATPASTTTADLYWTPATGTITGYNVFRGTTAGGESTTPINSSPLSANADSYVDTTGVPGNTYFYVVKAINGAAVSPASNEFKVTLPASGPATQVDLSGEYNLVGITANERPLLGWRVGRQRKCPVGKAAGHEPDLERDHLYHRPGRIQQRDPGFRPADRSAARRVLEGGIAGDRHQRRPTQPDVHDQLHHRQPDRCDAKH